MANATASYYLWSAYYEENNAICFIQGYGNYMPSNEKLIQKIKENNPGAKDVIVLGISKLSKEEMETFLGKKTIDDRSK